MTPRFDTSLTTRQRESLQAMLHDLLFDGRSLWDAFRQELITHTELRNALLAHTQAFLIAEAGSPQLEDRPAWDRFTCHLVPSFERVLFPSKSPENVASLSHEGTP